MKIDKQQCSEDVWDSTSWQNYKCTKKSIVEKEGKLYCKIHDPEYKKEKERKQREKYNKECCKKCDYHFNNNYYSFCPLCGNKRLTP